MHRELDKMDRVTGCNFGPVIDFIISRGKLITYGWEMKQFNGLAEFCDFFLIEGETDAKSY